MELKLLDDERALTRDEIVAHIREGVLAARADVVGIIVIGSFARGDRWRDLDVLVVLESLAGGNAGWVETALTLRRAVNLEALEVIPYSQRGFINGLQKHTPFLLDVATDGLLLYDRANLSQSLAETRQYIRDKGIRRTRPGGWQYPVLYRRSTPLSEQRNEDYVRRWLEAAARDEEAAQALRERGLHDRSVYHCQQSVERAVKASLACFGTFERSHFVATDLRRAVNRQNLGDWGAHLGKLADSAERLEGHVSRTRYIIEDEGGENLWVPSEHYFDADSAAAIRQAQEALRVAREYVAWWFAPDEDRPPDR